jgi:hypothetical protein
MPLRSRQEARTRRLLLGGKLGLGPRVAMGWIAMSRKDLHRFEVLSEVVCGRRSVASAAEMVEISQR